VEIPKLKPVSSLPYSSVFFNYSILNLDLAPVLFGTQVITIDLIGDEKNIPHLEINFKPSRKSPLKGLFFFA
jgi:hypothetical protein